MTRLIFAGAIEVLQLSGQIVVAHLQRIVLLGGIRVDGAEVGDATVDLEQGVLHLGTVLQGRHGKRRLQGHGQVGRDVVHRRLHLKLEPPLLHASLAQPLAYAIEEGVGLMGPAAGLGDGGMQAGGGVLGGRKGLQVADAGIADALGVGGALGERGLRQLRLGEAVGDAMGLAAQRRQLLA